MNDEHNTPEQVALSLFQLIANVEQRAMHSGATGGWRSADRQWILSTYAECLRTVQEPKTKTESQQAVQAPALVPPVPAMTKPAQRRLFS